VCAQERYEEKCHRTFRGFLAVRRFVVRHSIAASRQRRYGVGECKDQNWNHEEQYIVPSQHEENRHGQWEIDLATGRARHAVKDAAKSPLQRTDPTNRKHAGDGQSAEKQNRPCRMKQIRQKQGDQPCPEVRELTHQFRVRGKSALPGAQHDQYCGDRAGDERDANPRIRAHTISSTTNAE